MDLLVSKIAQILQLSAIYPENRMNLNTLVLVLIDPWDELTYQTSNQPSGGFSFRLFNSNSLLSTDEFCQKHKFISSSSSSSFLPKSLKTFTTTKHQLISGTKCVILAWKFFLNSELLMNYNNWWFREKCLRC